MVAHPFIKWVGGKGKITKSFLDLMPRTIRTYYEPFTGGGAMFYALAAEGRFEKAVLNDWNRELIDTYRAVRDTPEELIAVLKTYPNDSDFFYKLRAEDTWQLEPLLRAARMIYLNKTCFNGLFRMNKAGKFNSPYGKYPNPCICDADNIRACSKVLSNDVSLHHGDFSLIVDTAGPGDVVYFDPPYVPLTITSNFTSYTSDGFSLADQERLAALFTQLAARGVSVLLSNSDTPIVRELYKAFELVEIKVRRNINSRGDARDPVGELIVVSGRPVAEVAIEYEEEPNPSRSQSHP